MSRSELKPYEKTKNSSILWIDKLPYHWEVVRGKAIYEKLNRPTRESDEVITCFRDGTVTLRKNRRTTGFTESIKEIGYQGIKKGDLVIHVMDAFAGAVGVSDSNGKGTPVYSVCKPKTDLNNYYYAYVVREMAKTGFIQSLYRGIRERSSDFRFDVFANQYLPIPPRQEQDQIVRYLDHKLSKINKFIKAKKKLIEGLKEQKQAIISEAVTKGLDPNVKMKSSGIEWLGDMPQHWEIRKLNQIADLTLSGLDKKSYPDQCTVRLCNYVDVYKNDYINSSIQFMVATARDEDIRKLTLKKGDILLTKDSESWNDIAVPALVNEDLENVLCAYHLALIRLNSKTVCSEYIYYSFMASYLSIQYKLCAKGVTRYGLSYQAIRDARIVIPPIIEQVKISEYILDNISGINSMISKIVQEIQLIQEYKNALISDVVTGKVDIRHIKVEETAEFEELDIEKEPTDEESSETEDGVE